MLREFVKWGGSGVCILLDVIGDGHGSLTHGRKGRAHCVIFFRKYEYIQIFREVRTGPLFAYSIAKSITF